MITKFNKKKNRRKFSSSPSFRLIQYYNNYEKIDQINALIKHWKKNHNKSFLEISDDTIEKDKIKMLKRKNNKSDFRCFELCRGIL